MISAFIVAGSTHTTYCKTLQYEAPCVAVTTITGCVSSDSVVTEFQWCVCMPYLICDLPLLPHSTHLSCLHHIQHVHHFDCRLPVPPVLVQFSFCRSRLSCPDEDDLSLRLMAWQWVYHVYNIATKSYCAFGPTCIIQVCTCIFTYIHTIMPHSRNIILCVYTSWCAY